MKRRRRTGAVLLGICAALLLSAAAAAHPLGNFTINHYTGLRVAPDRILVDQVLDLAEIPAFQEIQAIDTASDGTPAPERVAAHALARCRALAGDLQLEVDGHRLDLALTATSLTFPPGAGGLATLRLVCEYEARLPTSLTAGAAITFADLSYAERIGWREILVEGDGTTVAGGGLLRAGVSGRLTSYPQDLLTQPLSLASVAFTAAPGGPALPPLAIADARPVAAVPNGVTELPAQLAAILRADDLTPPLVALALLIALGLGALHAVTPGHGKTIMAAYLVGTRGSVAQALGLGTTVAVSHTLGVLALGLLTVAASSIFPTERLFPLLGTVSGVLVVGIGAWLLVSLARQLRRRRVAQREHAEAHAHQLDHAHEHEHDHGHDHEEGAHGWHEHGGVRHTHLPPPGIEGTLRWRGIFTLGLAGGLVPSASAILLLLGAVSVGRPAFGLVLIGAFGAGMALVLAGIGLVLVYAGGYVERLPRVARDGRFATATSLAAACVVLAFGLVITTQAVAGLRL